jgi:hypothetical protein
MRVGVRRGFLGEILHSTLSTLFMCDVGCRLLMMMMMLVKIYSNLISNIRLFTYMLFS